jgi:hypothetical protein
MIDIFQSKYNFDCFQSFTLDEFSIKCQSIPEQKFKIV